MVLHESQRRFARFGQRTDENVIARRLTGTLGRPEVVIVGAHYDTVLGSQGANDNGSGVAAMRVI